MSSDTVSPYDLLIAAVQTNNAERVRQVLVDHPGVAAHLDRGTDALGFGATPLIGAVRRGNRAMVDVLLDAGANPDQGSDWWAGRFTPLDSTDDRSMADHLVARGATVDVHAAARHGMHATLAELLHANPALASARGGDGQTPLHVACDVATAQLLLSHGTDVNARDVDHESTAAQYLVRARTDVTRYLVAYGSDTDILMASALGDLALVKRLVAEDPGRIETTVSSEFFPMKNPRAGGTIYIWTLGSDKTPHLIAREFGHEDVVAWLMANSPDAVKMVQACVLGDEALFKQLLASRPGMVDSLSAAEQRYVVDAAANNNAGAVRLMLEAGWPVGVPDAHGATPLHWAGWHGNAEMVREILRFNPPLDVRENSYDAAPVGWAIHGSRHNSHAATQDHVGAVTAMADAGAKLPELDADAQASAAVIAVVRQRRQA
jgi:ankyrin repeat protein